MRGMHVLSDRRSRTHLVCVLVVFLLIMTSVWVLNLLNVIGGSWSTILNAIFTGLGSIVAFLQWHEQAISEAPCTAGLPVPDKALPHEQFVLDVDNKRKGAIVVYASRKWRGITLHLISGLQEAAGPIQAASNFVERHIGEQRQFLCHFPAVSPGHYTLVAHSGQRRVQVTVYPGHLSEIDWR